MTFRSRWQGERAAFRGGTAALPGRRLRERADADQRHDAPPAGRVGANGIRNGLYSIHIRMLDGIDGGNTGVMMLQDGRIRGGDAYFDYIGAYTAGTAMEGRDRQPRAHAEPRRATAVRRP